MRGYDYLANMTEKHGTQRVSGDESDLSCAAWVSDRVSLGQSNQHERKDSLQPRTFFPRICWPSNLRRHCHTDARDG